MFVKECTDLLNDISYLLTELVSKDILLSLSVSDVWGLIEYKLLKLRDTTFTQKGFTPNCSRKRDESDSSLSEKPDHQEPNDDYDNLAKTIEEEISNNIEEVSSYNLN